MNVLDTNDMLDKELNRILNIKEETDQKLIEAYQQISDLEIFKSKTAILLVFEVLNLSCIYVHFKCNVLVNIL